LCDGWIKVISLPNWKPQHYTCLGEVPKLPTLLAFFGNPKYKICEKTMASTGSLMSAKRMQMLPRRHLWYLPLPFLVIRGPINCSMVECDVWMYKTSPILLLNVMKVAKLWNWKFIFGNCPLKLSERNSSKPYSNGLKWDHHFEKQNIMLLHATFEKLSSFHYSNFIRRDGFTDTLCEKLNDNKQCMQI